MRSFAYALLALPLVACSNKSDGGNTQPADAAPETPATVDSFTPKGCAYTVKHPAIDGFPGFDLHADVASADPQLRYVFRGLGGDVTSGGNGYADPSTSFAIGWQTDDATTASRIRYGTSADKLDQTADGYSYLLDLGGSTVRFHEAHVCGLAPGRTYYYQVGGGPAGKEVWSTVASTTTAPAVGGTDAVKIGIVGDTRDATGMTDLPVWHAITTRYKADGTPLVLFSGDMVIVGANQGYWDIWNKAAQDASPSTFFALAPGNHENEQVRFFAHAVMPGAPTDNAKRYASFDYGPVHVVMIDDYQGIVAPTIDDTNYKPELLAWLDKDLAAANGNRAKVPWIVTFHHHPLYSDTTDTSRAKESQRMRDAFLSLYEKYGVDLDLSGHDHFYERFQALKGGAPDPKGTVYLIDGAAGAPAYDVMDMHPLAAKVQKYDPTMGQGIYGIATVSTTSFKLTFRQMASATSGSPADDTVVDDFELAKR